MTSQDLADAIRDLREVAKSHLRTNRYYLVIQKIDEFLEVIRPLGFQDTNPVPTRPKPATLEESVASEGIEPLKRGGGRYHHERGRITNGLRSPRTQLVAQFDANVWQILVEIEGGGSGHQFGVDQGDPTGHLPEIQTSLFGPLRNLEEPIRILCDDVLLSERTLPASRSPIFFRVVHGDFARYVTHPSPGLNLAMVPTDWIYNQKKSGTPPIEPEACGIPGYGMHYFVAGANSVLGFDRPGQEPIEFRLKPRFYLEGRRLLDSETRLGTLFVEDPPKLRHLNGGFASVHTIVVGEEGRGTGKWRQAYERHSSDRDDWLVPSGITNQGSGWYFVRLYDAADELIDSLDFRYIPGLRQIAVSKPRSDPDISVSVEFVHTSGVSISRLGSRMNSISSVLGRQAGNGSNPVTRFEWPSNPDIREVVFEIEDSGKPVRVTVDTDRVWWALVDTSQRNSIAQWQSCSLTLPPQTFDKTTGSELWIRFPRSAAAESFIGFEIGTRRAIRAANAEGIVRLQLSEFREVRELRTLGTHTLHVWLSNEGQEAQLDIATVTISQTCQWCQLQMQTQEEVVNHLLAEHHDNLFERFEVRDDEVIGSATPEAVYVCMECGVVYPTDPLRQRDPTTRMGRHFDKEHPHTSVHFRSVSEPREIRNLLGRDWFWNCKIGSCRPIIPTSDDEFVLSAKKAHLAEGHSDGFFLVKDNLDRETEPTRQDPKREDKSSVEVAVFENGVQIDRVTRPLRSLEGQPAVKYRKQLRHLVDGNNIYLDGREPIGKANSGSSQPSESAASDLVEDEGAPEDEVNWDDQQLKVIHAEPSARILVSAGPGTGKTAVACARVAELINQHDLTPSRVWLISFTRTAVREIADRIASYLDEPGSAFSIKIATLDAHAWTIHSGFDEEATLLGSYDENIERVREIIHENPEARQHLENVEHLIVDEAQDIVGIRADLVSEIIASLTSHCGITIFADEAQAIYGFANGEDAATGASPEPTLLDKLRTTYGTAIQAMELSTVHRTRSPQLLEIFTETRRHILDPGSNGADKLATVTNDVWRLSHGQVPEIAKQDIAEHDNLFVLFRRRSDVLMASSFLGEVPHRIRMSGMPICIAPWIGAVFSDYTEPDIDQSAFESLWSSRVLGNGPTVSVEESWRQLVRLAGRTETVLDMRRLRRQLGRARPPAELCSPELGDHGPVVGTIHASKGREADVVHIMLPTTSGESADLDEEARVIFVAATRGRKKLMVGRGYKKGASCVDPSGRVYRLIKGEAAKAQVEIGRDGDIGAEGLCGRKFYRDADEVRECQQLIDGLHCKTTAAFALSDRDTDFSFRLTPVECDRSVAVLSPIVNADLFRIGRAFQERNGGPRRRPPDQIRHLRILGVRTLVLPLDAAEAERLYAPWNTTGIMLAPILLGYTTVYLPAYA